MFCLVSHTYSVQGKPDYKLQPGKGETWLKHLNRVFLHWLKRDYCRTSKNIIMKLRCPLILTLSSIILQNSFFYGWFYQCLICMWSHSEKAKLLFMMHGSVYPCLLLLSSDLPNLSSWNQSCHGFEVLSIWDNKDISSLISLTEPHVRAA